MPFVAGGAPGPPPGGPVPNPRAPLPPSKQIKTLSKLRICFGTSSGYMYVLLLCFLWPPFLEIIMSLILELLGVDFELSS